VQRETFFTRFESDTAILYFYEDFLEAYDPGLREQFGVWYTPEEVVEYMVERVDKTLRTELGLPLGFADKSVHVLDPCTGTGSYLLAVIRRIHKTLSEEGMLDAFGMNDLKEAAKSRLYGFEIMPAPFVIAHMKLSLELGKLGAPLLEDERLSIYLTNALTGYGNPNTPQFADHGEFLREWEQASGVKKGEKVLVVLGNPPYNSYAGISTSPEELELTSAYREVVNAPRPTGQGLNDLYVRFFRMAERQIIEKTTRGVVAYISNYSWLDGLSFTGMREKYLRVFDNIWIDNLNGDSRRTGKVTPDGFPDPSIFSTSRNREGIQVGTAVAIMVRKGEHQATTNVFYRDLWGTGKHATLTQEALGETQPEYHTVTPEVRLGFPFRPTLVQGDYLSWPTLEELFPTSFPGVKTSRDSVLVDIDRERLEERMRFYFDPEVLEAEVERVLPTVMAKNSSFDGPATRRSLLKKGYKQEQLIPYTYRPFDVRWLYWESETKLLDRNRENYIPHIESGQPWIITQQKPRGDRDAAQLTEALACLDLLDRGASSFPLHLRQDMGQLTAHLEEKEFKPNLTPQAANYLVRIGGTPEDLFFHALAVMHAPEYRKQNAGALRQDWPRIPLPVTLEQLQSSAELGRGVAALLNPEAPFSPTPELRKIGCIEKVGGGSPTAEDRRLTASWGRKQAETVMPGRGKTESTVGEFDTALGEVALRVYLNDNLFWENVPESVWNYSMGGYQVVKKWLSYREQDVLGRALSIDEIRYASSMFQRIACLLLLSKELDASYGLSTFSHPE
jgi:predicted helicase